MAKNWKVGEAVVALHSGVKEDIIDIGRRFPLFSVLAAQVNEAATQILLAMPDYMTARKVESLLKGDAQDPSDEGSDDETPAAAPAAAKEKPAAAVKQSAAKANEVVLEGKSAKELYAICQELGITVETRQPAEIYTKAIKKHQADEAKKAAKAAATKPAAAASDEWDEDPVAAAAPAGKAKPKAKDEDDEWDI